MAKQSPGFSIIETVIVVAVVIAAGLGGWYVWQKNHKANSTTSSNTTTQTKQSNTQSQTADPSEGGKYLVITEWNVRMPLAAELQDDVKYGVFVFKTGEQTVYFASKKLAAKSINGGCDLKEISEDNGQGVSGGILAVTRSKTQPEVVDQRSFHDDATDYWYTTEPSNGGACYMGDSGLEKSTFNTLMADAIKHLQSVK